MQPWAPGREPPEAEQWGGAISVQLVARMGRDGETGPLKRSRLCLNVLGRRLLEGLLTVCLQEICLLKTLKHDHPR